MDATPDARRKTLALLDTMWPDPVDCLAGKVPASLPEMTAQGEHWLNRVSYFDRMQEGIRSGSVLCLGDSLIEGMAVNEISPFAVNMGIGGESMRNVLNRINRPVIHRAGACVLLTGINDVFREKAVVGPASMRMSLEFLWVQLVMWMTGKWVICKMLPINESLVTGVTNADIAPINDRIGALCAGCSNVRVVDVTKDLAPTGQLLPMYTVDGLHLSAAGQNILRTRIRTALTELGV